MNFTESVSKFKVISIYVTTSIIGVLLIFMAVYNASTEIEILHEIDQIHKIFSTKAKKHINSLSLNELISSLELPQYRVYVFPVNPNSNIGNLQVTAHELLSSKITEHGGYLAVKDETYTWTLISLAPEEKSLIVIHHFKSNGISNFIIAYKNRLIIPSIFFIWMTVWGALVLRHFVKQILLQKEEAEYLALHDPLTGLANRSLFNKKLDEIYQYSLRHHDSFCIALIDLDKFKAINDHYGHNVGDELLKQVSKRLQILLRRYDLVARLGGDEFIILFPDTGKKQGLEISERVHASLVSPYNLNGNNLTIGASIGIAVYPEHAEVMDELLKLADLAMYRAKNMGSGIEFAQ